MKNAELSIVRKNEITYVFLISAWIMILLHAFFPHHHAQCCEIDVELTVCDVQENEDQSLYSFLQHLVSNNSGDESLHHFSNKLEKVHKVSIIDADLDSDDFSVLYSFDNKYFPLHISPIIPQKDYKLNTLEVFQHQITSLSISFRGPPSVA